MDATQILADVQLALSAAKQAFELGQDAKPFVTDAYQIVVSRKPLTAEARQAMQDREVALRQQIDDIIAADDAAG